MKRVHFETDETYIVEGRRRHLIRFALRITRSYHYLDLEIVLAQLCLHHKYYWILGFKYVDTFERLENKRKRYDFSITSLSM